jgi:hypothetical protein
LLKGFAACRSNSTVDRSFAQPLFNTGGQAALVEDAFQTAMFSLAGKATSPSAVRK